MMQAVNLGQLLQGLPVAASLPDELQRWQPAQLQDDSRLLGEGGLFLAWPGERQDGRDFLLQAAKSGAKAALVDAGAGKWREQRAAAEARGMAVLECDGLKQQLAEIAGRFYQWPDRQLCVLAVTGSAGKTSCAWLAAQMLTALGQDCGYIGTLGAGYAESGELRETLNTTPDPLRLRRELRWLVDGGAQAVALEASSQGLEQNRLLDCQVRVAALTNLGREHLESHGGVEALKRAKRGLFVAKSLQTVVLNLDDAFGLQVQQELSTERRDVRQVGVSQSADAELRILSDGVRTPAGKVKTPHLPGEYNRYNFACALGMAHAAGADWQHLLDIAAGLRLPPGRMQRVLSTPVCYVDYAHTPESLQAVLQQARKLCKGRLWLVFGCGGERDKGKRPQMGAIADEMADSIVLTDDNPRSEDGDAIVGEIAAGLAGRARLQIERDRAKAIHSALQQARDQDLVLIAGRGHERTQHGNSGTVQLNDASCVAEWERHRKTTVGGEAR